MGLLSSPWSSREHGDGSGSAAAGTQSDVAYAARDAPPRSPSSLRAPMSSKVSGG
jgi:hypothetical protein